MEQIALISHLSPRPECALTWSDMGDNAQNKIISVDSYSNLSAIKSRLIKLAEEEISKFSGAIPIKPFKIYDDIKKVTGLNEYVWVDTFDNDKKMHLIYCSQREASGWTGKYLINENRYIGYFEAIPSKELLGDIQQSIDQKNSYIYSLEMSDANNIDKIQKLEDKCRVSGDYIDTLLAENSQLRKLHEYTENMYNEVCEKSKSKSTNEITSRPEQSEKPPKKMTNKGAAPILLQQQNLLLAAATFDRTKLLTREQRDQKLRAESIKKLKHHGETACLTTSGLLF